MVYDQLEDVRPAIWSHRQILQSLKPLRPIRTPPSAPGHFTVDSPAAHGSYSQHVLRVWRAVTAHRHTAAVGTDPAPSSLRLCERLMSDGVGKAESVRQPENEGSIPLQVQQEHLEQLLLQRLCGL